MNLLRTQIHVDDILKDVNKFVATINKVGKNSLNFNNSKAFQIEKL